MEDEVKIGWRDRVLMNVPLTQKMLLGFYGAALALIIQLYVAWEHSTSSMQAALEHHLASSLNVLSLVSEKNMDKEEALTLLNASAGSQFQVTLSATSKAAASNSVSASHTASGYTVVITQVEEDVQNQDLLASTLIYGLGALALVFFLASSVSANLLPLIDYIIDVMKVIASGKLDRKVGFSGDDEFGQLGGAIDGTIGNISELIHLISNSTQELNSTVHGITSQSKEASLAVKVQSENIESVSTSMSDMKHSIHEVAVSTEDASGLAQKSNDNAQHAKTSVHNSISVIKALSLNIQESSMAVGQLEENAEKIGSVIEVINGISEQTNLLALNAAIEAARAGEQGRGFAVVADEVRTLAQRTQGATVEIKAMIESLQDGSSKVSGFMGQSVENAQKGLEQVNSAIEDIDQIADFVNHISDMNMAISTAMRHQENSAEDISNRLQQIKASSEISLNQVTSILQGNDVIEKTALNLAEALKKYS